FGSRPRAGAPRSSASSVMPERARRRSPSTSPRVATARSCLRPSPARRRSLKKCNKYGYFLHFSRQKSTRGYTVTYRSSVLDFSGDMGRWWGGQRSRVPGHQPKRSALGGGTVTGVGGLPSQH